MNNLKRENTTVKEILNTLLSEGSVILDEMGQKVSVSRLNEFLTPMNFVVVRWPGSRELILVDYDKKINKEAKISCIPPWKESTSKEAKNVFEQIAHKETPRESLVDFLCEKKYLYKTEEGFYKFTKRTLLNYDEFLMEINPLRYRKCKICDLIVEDLLIHKECKIDS
ncbi:hypothetical protein NUSPORA_02231 [Nucleospora cyclopteri]